MCRDKEITSFRRLCRIIFSHLTNKITTWRQHFGAPVNFENPMRHFTVPHKNFSNLPYKHVMSYLHAMTRQNNDRRSWITSWNHKFQQASHKWIIFTMTCLVRNKVCCWIFSTLPDLWPVVWSLSFWGQHLKKLSSAIFWQSRYTHLFFY